MQDNAAQKNIQTYPDRFLPLEGKVNTSQFAQFKLDVSNVGGKQYGVPFDNGATGLFLRRDIVENAGLKVEDFNDITWERFIELGKIVKQKTGVTMVSTTATDADFIMLMLQSAGVWFFDGDKVTIKDNAALRNAIDVFSQGVKEGVILLVNDWNAYIASLNNGTVASTVQGCWIIGSIVLAEDQAGKWALVTTPKLGKTPSSVNYSSQGGSGWLVLKNSQNPDAAMDFLDKTFAGSVEFYETILPNSGAISTWLPAAASPVYAQPHPFFNGQKIYEELVSYAGKVPKVKYGIFNYEARTAVARGMMDVMNGTATIDSALDSAQKEVEFIINQ
jgi:lactose/L-arabinose transport system substrate-binding protein